MNRIRIVIFTSLFCASLFEMQAQTNADSLQQARNDSVSRIQLIVKSIPADRSDLIVELDSNQSLLKKYSESSRSLNNFQSAQFRLSNQQYTGRIYETGINTLNFRLSDFDNYSFLLPNKPVAEISTHRGRAFVNSDAGFQENSDVHLIFAENFRNRLLWNFSFDRNDYQGIYTNGTYESTLFTTGIRYSGKNDLFHLNLIYLDERHTIQSNWGIRTDSVFSDPNFSIRESVPVHIASAVTNSFERSVGMNLDFPIIKSTSGLNPIFFIKSYFTNYSFNYFDQKDTTTKDIYKIFWMDTSINFLLKQQVFTNAIGLKLLAFDKLESKLGFRYEHNRYDHGDTLTSTHDLYQFEIETRYNPDSNIVIDGQWKLKRFQNNFAPDLEFDLHYKYSTYLSFTGRAFLNSTPIPYVYQYLVLNKNYFWNLNYDHHFIQESGLSIGIKSESFFNSTLRLSWSVFRNFIYLDTLSLPISTDRMKKFNVQVHLPLKYKWLKLNSKFNYDLFTPDPMNFSGWNSIHTLSLNRSLFKKVVNADIGASLKIYDYKYKLNFNPIIQLFHASYVPSEMITSVGLFMHFQVSNFQLLFDFDNLDSFWHDKRPSLVNSYPFYDFFFTFGLQWKFLN